MNKIPNFPPNTQQMDLRTLPADEWIKEIRWRIVTGYRTQLKREETNCQSLIAERARMNPLNPDPLDTATAMFVAKAMTFGDWYQDAFVAVHGPKASIDGCRAASRLKSCEKLAQIPKYREHLEGTVASLLRKDARLASGIVECQTKIRSLKANLKHAADLIALLKRLGKVSVTMAQQTGQDSCCPSLPTMDIAESSRLAAMTKGPKVHL